MKENKIVNTGSTSHSLYSQTISSQMKNQGFRNASLDKLLKNISSEKQILASSTGFNIGKLKERSDTLTKLRFK